LSGLLDLAARLVARLLLDGVHMIGIESDVVPDRGDRGIGRLIGPDGVDRTLTPQRDAVLGAVALVRAVGDVLRPLEKRGDEERRASTPGRRPADD
jgi:hypothetical protein